MKHIIGKLLIIPVVGALLLLGLLGLLIPVIPGLVFLAIAAAMVARHFPAAENYLNRNRHYAECARVTDGMTNLDIWGRVQLGFWWSMKLMVNGAEWAVKKLNGVRPH